MSKSSSKFSFNIDDILCHTTSTASVSVPTVSSYTNSITTEFPSDFYTSNMTAIPEITHFIPPRYYFSNPNLQHFTCIDQYSNTFPKGKFEILYRRNLLKFPQNTLQMESIEIFSIWQSFRKKNYSTHSLIWYEKKTLQRIKWFKWRCYQQLFKGLNKLVNKNCWIYLKQFIYWFDGIKYIIFNLFVIDHHI